jgi:hypothetical protein
MRILIAVLSLLISPTLFAQPNSVRLFGMGNVSLAVPDIEGEAFINPGKITRLPGLFVRVHPAYFKHGRSTDNSSSYISRGSIDSYKSKMETHQSDFTAPVDIAISLGPISIGGSAHYQLSSGADEYESSSSSSSTTGNYSWKRETSGPTMSISLLGALDLEIFSIGASVGISDFGQDSKSSYFNSSSPGSSNSSQEEYRLDGRTTSLKMGLPQAQKKTLRFPFMENLTSSDMNSGQRSLFGTEVLSQ